MWYSISLGRWLYIVFEWMDGEIGDSWPSVHALNFMLTIGSWNWNGSSVCSV
jgi:hypothetical protein